MLTHASKVHPQIRAECETPTAPSGKRLRTAWARSRAAVAAAPHDRLAVLSKPDNRIFHRMRGGQRKRRLAGRRGRGRMETGEAAAQLHETRDGRAGHAQSDRIRLRSRLNCSWGGPRTGHMRTKSARRSSSPRRGLDAGGGAVGRRIQTKKEASRRRSGWATCST